MTRSRERVAIGLLFLLLGGHASLAAASERERISQVLALREGMHVADVGAGNGSWTEHLAHEVGETGQVYATEIGAEDVETIQRRVSQAGFDNVTTLLGTATDTALPAGCCDGILLRLVYHHFTEPSSMRASLWRALRPGGRVVIVEIDPQRGWRDLPGVPDRGGHGIGQDELVREMTSAGFQVVTRHESWNDNSNRYCIVFQRATCALASPGLDEEVPTNDLGSGRYASR